MKGLAGKIALVTGGASGLGRAIAARFAGEGAKVVISDVQETAGALVATELGVAFVTQDVSDEAAWSATVEWIKHRFGRIDILVNNAGIVGPMDAVSPESTRLSDWRRLFAVNVEGVFLGCRAVIPVMRGSGGGVIINMSSVAGLLATPYATAYGATKAAVCQLTKSVAQYCAEERLAIRCISIHPGIVRTPLWDGVTREVAGRRGMNFEDAVIDAEARVPLGTLTTPEDIAAAVAFVSSDEARHITGTELVIDGGIVGCSTFRVERRKT